LRWLTRWPAWSGHYWPTAERFKGASVRHRPVPRRS